MAAPFSAEVLAAAVRVREGLDDVDGGQRFNAFRSRIKEFVTLRAGEASELYKAAGLAIQQKSTETAPAPADPSLNPSPAAATAPRADGPSIVGDGENITRRSEHQNHPVRPL